MDEHRQRVSWCHTARSATVWITDEHRRAGMTTTKFVFSGLGVRFPRGAPPLTWGYSPSSVRLFPTDLEGLVTGWSPRFLGTRAAARSAASRPTPSKRC